MKKYIIYLDTFTVCKVNADCLQIDGSGATLLIGKEVIAHFPNGRYSAVVLSNSLVVTTNV